MKLALMQPYFFPYLGYFGLIKHTDKWIVFDTPQFINRGWIHRNRILKPAHGWQYIHVPIEKHSQKTSIMDIKIRNSENWIKLILDKLKVYKKIAHYYVQTTEVIEKSLSVKTDNLAILNCNTIKEVCKYIGIEWDFSLFSVMNLKIDDVKKPDEWALNICKSLGNVTEYWNLPGGISLYDKEKFERDNIILRFYNQELNSYNQNRELFEPGLSIIDVMMFNSKEEIKNQLNNYNFICPGEI